MNCKAKTKDGKPCGSIGAIKGSDFCLFHTKGGEKVDLTRPKNRLPTKARKIWIAEEEIRKLRKLPPSEKVSQEIRHWLLYLEAIESNKKSDESKEDSVTKFYEEKEKSE